METTTTTHSYAHPTTTPTVPTVRTPVPELQVGDRILDVHGMNLTVEAVRDVSYLHPNADGPVHSCRCRIDNLEHTVAERLVPRSWVADGRWTVQGNSLATVRVAL